MRKIRQIAVLALVLSLPVASSAGAHSVSDAERIQALQYAWEAAINLRDLQGILSLYGDGAVVLPAGRPPVLGRESIAGWHARWYVDTDVHYELDCSKLRLQGGLASEEWRAVVTLTARADRQTGIGGDPMQFTQRGVRVYRKDADGTWRIDRETWSTMPEVTAGLTGKPLTATTGSEPSIR